MTKSTQPQSPAAITGFFNTEQGSQPYCSIAAALQLNMVLPDEDGISMYIPRRGSKIPFAVAVSMGIVDEAAVEAIRQHPSVHRKPRGSIEHVPPAAPRGPLAATEGTLSGAAAAALVKYVSTRSEDDAASFAAALQAALDVR
jgi:hypothetical protein